MGWGAINLNRDERTNEARYDKLNGTNIEAIETTRQAREANASSDGAGDCGRVFSATATANARAGESNLGSDYV